MNIPTMITPTNLLLWILMTLLLVWLATFAILALRRDSKSTSTLNRSRLTAATQQQLQQLTIQPLQATKRAARAAANQSKEAVLERSLS